HTPDLPAWVVLTAGGGGVGLGLAYRPPRASVAAAAPPDRRAAVISTLFVVAYTGISIPVIGVGVLADPLGLEGAGLVFIACMLVLVASAAAYLIRRPVAAKGP
ncbi:MFS transporter, partial [Streptomyces sp. NPDC059556]